MIMAKPVELTPTLKGKDAERFLRQMDEVKPGFERGDGQDQKEL